MEKKQTAVEWLAERCGGMYQEGLGIDYYNETYGGQDENP
jgi:hypothetical protein